MTAAAAADGAAGPAGPVAVAAQSAAPSAEAQDADATGGLATYSLRRRDAETLRLPRSLSEASGLATAGAGHLWIHDDEVGRVYRIDPAAGRVVEIHELGPGRIRADFEGVAAAEGRVWLVTSGGVLAWFRPRPGGGRVAFEQATTGVGGRCEVEGLAWDAPTRALLLACKTVYDADLHGRVVVFAWDPERGRLEPEPRVAVPLPALRALDLGRRFHPSAIEVHPSTGRYWILAGPEAALLEVDRDGTPRAGRELSGRVHEQPEGLAFDLDAAVWIADEHAGRSHATLTRYAAPGGEGR